MLPGRIIVVSASSRAVREAFAGQLAALEARLEDAFEQAWLTLGALADGVSAPTAEQAAAIGRSAQELCDVSRGADRDLVIVTARQARPSQGHHHGEAIDRLVVGVRNGAGAGRGPRLASARVQAPS